MLGHSIVSLFAWAAGHHPPLRATAIVVGIFMLEDATTVLLAMQPEDGALSIPLALLSPYGGIILTDLSLHGIGWLSAKLPVIARYLSPHPTAATRSWLDGRAYKVVVISRLLPWLRLPTYTACGFLGTNLRQFVLAVDVAAAQRFAGRRRRTYALWRRQKQLMLMYPLND